MVWSIIPARGLDDNNDRVKWFASFDDCKRFCEHETDFTCRSFEYEVKKVKRCLLSRHSRWTKPEQYTLEEASWVYADWQCSEDKRSIGRKYKKFKHASTPSNEKAYISTKMVVSGKGCAFICAQTADCLLFAIESFAGIHQYRCTTFNSHTLCKNCGQPRIRANTDVYIVNQTPSA
ncbi:uncharacterized protein LOC141901221 [Tubulanus polymorphus]|uniref:uncharacterized protein LOC141901221 n=1 Tax=Tubulanus polymorphus TaxID=672921 RepID=UPI003DA3D79B